MFVGLRNKRPLLIRSDQPCGSSRGLFGKPPDEAHIKKVLRDLSLWEKKSAKITKFSEGMKRRVMIAKALSHVPKILFLDEPTSGVEVELCATCGHDPAPARERGHVNAKV